MSIDVTILGCGSSSGVPAIGNNWGNCDSNNPKNRRLRSSILIDTKGLRILVDATPDLRQQLLNSEVKYLDAVFITHCHADHINGIDDFRFLNVIMDKDIKLYATKEIIDTIRQRFAYVFDKLAPEAKGFYYKPCLIPKEINNKFTVGPLEIICFQQDHGYCETTGFRIEDFAYSPDVVNLDQNALSKLKNLKLWIVDCLRLTPHKTHAHLEKVIEWMNELKPEKTILTHMNYEVDYKYISSILPKNCFAAYDGMILKVR